MKLHLNKNEFIILIENLHNKFDIDLDILEKDYYVCCVLKELADNQEELQAYFKGGTSVYKIIDSIERFSEDIDLTVRRIKEQSNNKNKTRLEKSAKGYNIDGLVIDSERTKNVRYSVTTFYKYDTCFPKNLKNPLYKPGEIQVVSTSFTVSEPYENCIIEPLIYKFASDEEKKILEEQFDVKPFSVGVQTLERIFIDKIFASETYFRKGDYKNFAKHLFDINVLYKQDRIKDFLKNKDLFYTNMIYQRIEEQHRINGIPKDLKMEDFELFNLDYDDDLERNLQDMQNRYTIMPKYRIDLKTAIDTLNMIKIPLCKMEKEMQLDINKAVTIELLQ